MEKTSNDINRIFGANLRQLIDEQQGGNVSHVSREMPMNRTQLNRYLASAAWPRPDALDRICQYFGVDARVLLEPLDDIRNARRDVPHG